MVKKINDNRDDNKPRLTAEEIEQKLKKHLTVVPVGTPNEAQLRMMSIHIWMMEVARNPRGLPIFLALEHEAINQGYNPFVYRDKAQDLFNLLNAENQGYTGDRQHGPRRRCRRCEKLRTSTR